MENLVDGVQSHWLQYNMVLYCVKDHDKGKHPDECYSYIQEKAQHTVDREVSIEASGHRSVELQ